MSCNSETQSIVKNDKVATKEVIEKINNSKYSRNEIMLMQSFEDDARSIIEAKGLSLDKFNEMRAKSASLLTDSERETIKSIRETIPLLNEEILLQKAIPTGDIQKYTDGVYSPKVRGFVTRAQDVKRLNNYDDIYNSLRLDYKGTAYNQQNDNSMGVIRFKTIEANRAIIPYSPEIGGNIKDEFPFTGNGFTAATNGRIIPEYKFESFVNMEKGAEIYEITKDGQEILKAVLKDDKFVMNCSGSTEICKAK